MKLQQQALLLLEAECDVVANTALKNFAFFKSWMYAIDRFGFCTLWHPLDDNAKIISPSAGIVWTMNTKQCLQIILYVIPVSAPHPRYKYV